MFGPSFKNQTSWCLRDKVHFQTTVSQLYLQISKCNVAKQLFKIWMNGNNYGRAESRSNWQKVRFLSTLKCSSKSFLRKEQWSLCTKTRELRVALLASSLWPKLGPPPDHRLLLSFPTRAILFFIEDGLDVPENITYQVSSENYQRKFCV